MKSALICLSMSLGLSACEGPMGPQDLPGQLNPKNKH